MRVIPLQSGSNGNCIYVETLGIQLLFDAGISGKQARERLAAYGRDIRDVAGVVISHDHRDHTRCLGIYQRQFGLPVYITEPTLAAARAAGDLGPLGELVHFQAGGAMLFGEVVVETIPTPHDGVDGVGFVVDDGRQRVGILTDLGHPFPALREAMRSLDAVVLESNYDPEMLAQGPYPEFLQRRIRGPAGHLSNAEAAELLDLAFGCQLRWACLAHLSEHNNTPECALQTHGDLLGDDLPLYVASRYRAGPDLELG